ncbi:unnamed protein product, partial [Rhizoctonia solani]
MPIRDTVSRLKGKLKKRLGIGPPDGGSIPSSANLSTVSIHAPPGPSSSSALGQASLNTPPAPKIGNQSSTSIANIKDYPGTGSDHRNPTSSRTPEALPDAQPEPVYLPLPVNSTLQTPAGTHKDNQPADNARLEDNKQDSTAGLVWTGAKLLLQVVSASADVFPPLKSAVGGLNECISIYERANKGRKDYGHLLNKIDELLKELYEYVNDREAMEMTRSVERVCCELDLEVKKLKVKLEGPVAKQWLKAVDAPDEITECHRRIQQLLERLTLNATVNILKKLSRQNEKIDRQSMELRLKDMSPAKLSTYNSTASNNIGRGACTLGTREAQIQSLLEWARTPLAGKIYWMNGMAGTGKTTIAYSFCTELDSTSTPVNTSEVHDITQNNNSSALGASFFCSRVISECRQITNIFPTIAYQLARYSVPFNYALQTVLESDPDACTRALNIQYEKLIVGPLTIMQDSLPTDFIVVIDALDECENINSLREILGLLLSTPITLPVRFLVSSRPEPEISRQMEGRVNELGNTRLVLHNIDEHIVKSDIAIFMRHELQGIPMSPSQWSGLLERCGVLFIYASTTCRFIQNGYRSGFLSEAIDAIIDSTSVHMESGDEGAIDELYTTILVAALGKRSEMPQRQKNRIRDILETVLCAREPMKLLALANMLGLENAGQVDAILQPLRSVLNVTQDTEVVTTLHASFPDFMFSHDRSGEFYCEQKTRNLALAKACLHTINTIKIRFNIGEIPSSYWADDKVEGLEDQIKAAISPGLAYACRYWSIHLHHGEHEYEQRLVQSVRRLFTERLLVWMEVVNLTKQMHFGTNIMQHAEQWCLEQRVAEDLMMLARDAGQFVSVY